MFEIFKTTYTKNYANFNGRAGRREYWLFTAMFLIVYVVLAILGAILATMSGTLGAIIYGILGIFALASIVPGIAVTIRRMHDVNKSGWFCLIPVYSLILTLTPGDQGDNRFGPNPDTQA